MELICERRGQAEIGILTHDGHVFAAFGSSINGRHVTAYTRRQNGRISLTRWNGGLMLACRSRVVREYHDDSIALMFRLTKHRYIVGYALDDDGMLFRGELLTDCDENEAFNEALTIAEHWMGVDAEDEADSWHGEPDDDNSPDW